MTTTPPDAPHEPPPSTGPAPGPHDGPRVSRDEMRDLSRLRRSTYDRHVAGVAGGLGRHLDIDPIILRVAFVVTSFFGGAGLLAYVALWVLVPEDDSDRATFDLDGRTRNAALIGVGILAALLTLGDVWGGGPGWFPWPLIIIGVIAWLFISNRERRRESRAQGYGAPAAPAYGVGAAQTGWVGDAAETAPQGTPPGTPVPPQADRDWRRPRRPRDPRKRGPILFWFTLALIALAEGLLGTLDLAGVPVADSAYPALALGITAVMLLVGSVYGRAGGLILVGFVATLATIAATIAGQYDGGRLERSPATAGQVQDEYSLGSGEVIIDLTEVEDVENLDGRRIQAHVGMGRVEVILPDDVDVTIAAHTEIAGHLDLPGGEHGGSVRDNDFVDGGPGAPELELEAWVGLGEVKVTVR